jgi:hypothetical protein
METFIDDDDDDDDDGDDKNYMASEDLNRLQYISV